MKKIITGVLSAIFALTLVGCGEPNNPGGLTTVKAEDYEVDAEFITLADLPANPLSRKAIETYRELGFNVMLLTEDQATFTQGGKITEKYQEAIHNIGEAGLEVWIRNMYNDPDYFQNTEPGKVRSNYGTPYSIEERNITDELSAFSEITGYYMADEPFMTSDLSVTHYGAAYAAMDQYSKLVEWKNRYAPNAFWHMNHVPSQSYDHWPETATYQDFIQYYVDNIVSNVAAGAGRSVCLDNYPFTEKIPDGVSQSFLVDLLTAATVTRDYNETADEGKEATFGMCLQTFKNTASSVQLRYPTAANEITFQMYTGMALGAELFEYFCYRSLPSFGLYGLIDEKGAPTEEYDIVKEANEKALGFSKVISAFEWKNLVLSAAQNEGDVENEVSFASAKKFTKEEKGILETVTSKYDAIVGCFKKGKTDGYMVVNYSAPCKNRTNVIKLNFGDKKQVIVWKNGVSKVQKLLSGTLQLSLGAGEGVFVVPV